MSKQKHGCFQCKHATCAYIELEERMAVFCSVLQKTIPEKYENCLDFKSKGEPTPEDHEYGSDLKKKKREKVYIIMAENARIGNQCFVGFTSEKEANEAKTAAEALNYCRKGDMLFVRTLDLYDTAEDYLE